MRNKIDTVSKRGRRRNKPKVLRKVRLDLEDNTRGKQEDWLECSMKKK